MRKNIIILVLALFAPRIIPAQGVTYLSNLGLPSAAAVGIASNRWVGAGFKTGTNSGGYTLDSIQLAMADEIAVGGSPSNFMIMIYSGNTDSFHLPGSSLGTLSGSAGPSTVGIYTYTPASDLTLASSTFYSIVLTASTPSGSLAGGTFYTTYNWSYVNGNPSIYNPSDGWDSPYSYYSTNGTDWNWESGVFPQFAVTAEPVPEPGILSLAVLGSLLSVRYCRKRLGPRRKHKFQRNGRTFPWNPRLS